MKSYPLYGTHLIDASAGTGKTYTISSLYVRLLLERGLTVNQILVVTYTKAATEDLRVRVRHMVQNSLTAFEKGEGADDFEKALVDSISDHDLAKKRLIAALYNFDEAAIFTIHGFCQRMLRENSLESESLLDTELVPDLDNLLLVIAADFWRKQVEWLPESFLACYRQKIYPQSIFYFFKKLRPGHILMPDSGFRQLDQIRQSSDFGEAEKDFSVSLSKLSAAWQHVSGEVTSLLVDNDNLKKTNYNPARVLQCLDGMENLCRSAPPVWKLFDGFAWFLPEKLAAGTKKGYTPPVHSFFYLCQDVFICFNDLERLFDECRISLWHEAANYCRREFDRRKARKNVFTYDDLLEKLQQALVGPQGKRLIRLIGERYPAALIDEFQDTDPVQYDIFSSLYKPDSEKLLYIIGDPKQAIYSFRGADIFAYLRAIKDTGLPFTLNQNYRSEPDLVRAVNILFSSAEKPFVYDEIAFKPVSAARKNDRIFLQVAENSQSPFQVWQIMRKPYETKPLDKMEAQKRILASLTEEIGSLLAQGRDGLALIGSRPLGPKDIAVLVRENREAHMVQQALSQVHIDSVIQSADDLFVSQESIQLYRVLQSMSVPANEKYLLTALGTDFFGFTCDMLVALEENEEELSSWFAVFHEHHALWLQKGFMVVFRSFLRRHNVRQQLLRFADGERRLTNVLHLGEVLNQYEYEGNCNPMELLDWFAEKKGGAGAVEEYQLRLESDAERVQIVTIHRSKGLQYPVVFCPFSWAGARRKNDLLAFHLKNNDNLPALDIGSNERDLYLEWLKEEELAENMRLLYVALTRAVHRCYLFWGSFKGAETSALARILHAGRGEKIVAGYKSLSDDEISRDLAEVSGKSDGAIELVFAESDICQQDKVAEDILENLSCPVFNGKPVVVKVASFSAVSSTGGSAANRHIQQAGTDGTDDKTIFSFPKGAGPGLFMHDIFEHLDFAALEKDRQSCRDLVGKKLAEYRYDHVWLDAVFSMVENVLRTPLLPGGCFSLQQIPYDHRLNELEFYFPLAQVEAVAVEEALVDFGFADSAQSLKFSVGRGFLKGFIDLVVEHEGRFYLLDWKSNYLGPKIEDYCYERLKEVMVEEKYILQYLFYTLALHLYLQERLPGYHYEKHFGGVFYLFLRGVSSEKGSEYGIYHDVPKFALVDKLSRIMVA